MLDYEQKYRLSDLLKLQIHYTIIYLSSIITSITILISLQFSGVYTAHLPNSAICTGAQVDRRVLLTDILTYFKYL